MLREFAVCSAFCGVFLVSHNGHEISKNKVSQYSEEEVVVWYVQQKISYSAVLLLLLLVLLLVRHKTPAARRFTLLCCVVVLRSGFIASGGLAAARCINIHRNILQSAYRVRTSRYHIHRNKSLHMATYWKITNNTNFAACGSEIFHFLGYNYRRPSTYENVVGANTLRTGSKVYIVTY